MHALHKKPTINSATGRAVNDLNVNLPVERFGELQMELVFFGHTRTDRIDSQTMQWECCSVC